MVLNPPCAVCGTPAALVEVLAPGEMPDGYESWQASRRESYERFQGFTTWRFRYEDPGGGNGHGDRITPERAALLIEVFTPPIKVNRLDEVGVDGGMCLPCGKPYCRTHWNVSAVEYGHCPQGHGKSIDPHWHPDLD